MTRARVPRRAGALAASGLRYRVPRRAGALIAALALAGALAGCGGAADPAEVRAEAVTAVVDDIVVPAHTDLADATAALTQAVTALCDQPSDEHLTAARDAWRAAFTARAAERPVAVGPAMDRTSKAELDWQADPERIDEVLAGDDPVTPERVANGASGGRGLLAIEHLLFADGADALATGDQRRCDYAAAAAALADEETQRLADAFQGEEGDRLAGRGAVSMTTEAALDELVNTQVNVLDDMADTRLAPDTDAAAISGPAGQGAAWAAAELDTLARLYDEEHLGAALPDQTADSVRTAIDDATAQLDAVGPDLADADATLRQRVAEAADAARVAVRTDVVSALDVVLGFSDNDGDSG